MCVLERFIEFENQKRKYLIRIMNDIYGKPHKKVECY